MKCCGTSLFLKNKFGIGYHLSMNMEENADLNPVRYWDDEITKKIQLFYVKLNYPMYYTI